MLAAIPRGVTLSNPGDLERDGDAFHYDGEKVPSSDPVLREFIADSWGLRAILVCFLAYIRRDDIETLGAAIERYAPPGQNDTEAYKAAVCTACSAAEWTPFTVDWLHSHAELLLNIITQREVGRVYPAATTTLAISLAFGEQL